MTETTTGAEAGATNAPARPAGVFRSFLQGGIECSTHRLPGGRRVDPMAASGHAARFAEDYALLARHGLRTLRSGVRWPLAEPSPGRYRLADAAARARTAREAEVEVVWDLCHYGYPDDLDPFSPAFVARFAAYARAAARALAAETDGPLWVCPVNEISFWSWAGGDARYLNPFAAGRGFELKVNLARAVLEAIAAVREEAPGARVALAEPLIHIAAPPGRPDLVAEAEGHRQAQFQAFDLVTGRLWPGIGGYEDALDVVGLNVYGTNQWLHGLPADGGLRPGQYGYRPLSEQLAEVWARYRRPLFLAETGAEGDDRVPWLRHVGAEVRAALARGVPVEGVCLYPVLDYPGWDDDRHCPTGLVAGRPTLDGPRVAYDPLARALDDERRAYARAGVPEALLVADPEDVTA